MKKFESWIVVALVLLSTSCMSGRQAFKGPPPRDPIASVGASELRVRGLEFANSGDLVRAQQYLSAAMQKGFDESIVVPELIRVCVASLRLRAALAFAEPYLEDHPEDVGLQYVVGTIHMALGNLSQASEYLRRAVGGDARLEEAMFALGLVAVRQGKVELARTRLQRYLTANPHGRYGARAMRALAELEGPS